MIVLRRQSGYPVEKEDKEQFKKDYAEEFDKIHERYKEKQITIEQFAEESEKLYSTISSKFQMTKLAVVPAGDEGWSKLIKAFEAPVLLVINAETQQLEAILMDAEY